MGRSTTKQEWRESAKHMFTAIVYQMIQQDVYTKEVRFIIVDSLPDQGRRIIGCVVPTYKKEQEYAFFAEEIEGRTNIFVYQDEMCKNAHKYIVLSENTPLNQLDHDTQCLYRDMIANFLMANIVWK